MSQNTKKKGKIIYDDKYSTWKVKRLQISDRYACEFVCPKFFFGKSKDSIMKNKNKKKDSIMWKKRDKKTIDVKRDAKKS